MDIHSVWTPRSNNGFLGRRRLSPGRRAGYQGATDMMSQRFAIKPFAETLVDAPTDFALRCAALAA